MGEAILDLLVFLLVIGLVIGVFKAGVGLFFENIILFDSIALAIILGFLSHSRLHIHPAFSLIIGLVVLVALLLLQNSKFGFWIIGGLLSLFWGLVISAIVLDSTGGDIIWSNVSLGLGALLMIGLHFHARNSV